MILLQYTEGDKCAKIQYLQYHALIHFKLTLYRLNLKYMSVLSAQLERALRFVLKGHISNQRNLSLKSGFDSFRIYAVKSLVIESFQILEGMTPELFVKADNPYDTRDKFKFIHPLKRTTTHGLRSFQYYGAHVWNMLPINMEATQSLRELKSLIITARAEMFMSFIWGINMINANPLYHTLGAGAVGVTTMSSPLVSWAVTVTVCDDTVSCWVVTATRQLLSV